MSLTDKKSERDLAKKTFLCINDTGTEVYITCFPEIGKWKEREVPATEKLIVPSLIATTHKITSSHFDLVLHIVSKTRGAKSIYIYQTADSLKKQIDSIYRLIQSGAAQWFKTALITAIDKCILLKCRTRELELTPEVDKQYNIFQKCVALLSSDKIGEMEAAFNKAVLIGMKLINR